MTRSLSCQTRKASDTSIIPRAWRGPLVAASPALLRPQLSAPCPHPALVSRIRPSASACCVLHSTPTRPPPPRLCDPVCALLRPSIPSPAVSHHARLRRSTALHFSCRSRRFAQAQTHRAHPGVLVDYGDVFARGSSRSACVAHRCVSNCAPWVRPLFHVKLGSPQLTSPRRHAFQSHIVSATALGSNIPMLRRHSGKIRPSFRHCRGFVGRCPPAAHQMGSSAVFTHFFSSR